MRLAAQGMLPVNVITADIVRSLGGNLGCQQTVTTMPRAVHGIEFINVWIASIAMLSVQRTGSQHAAIIMGMDAQISVTSATHL